MLINLKTKKYDFVIEYKKIDEKIRQVNRSCVIKYKKKINTKRKKYQPSTVVFNEYVLSSGFKCMMTLVPRDTPSASEIS